MKENRPIEGAFFTRIKEAIRTIKEVRKLDKGIGIKSLYLNPAFTEFNYIQPYEITINRAALPEDKVGEPGLLEPKTLIYRLDSDLASIPGARSISQGRDNLYQILEEQEQALREGRSTGPEFLTYLLFGYQPPVDISLEKQDFLPNAKNPKGTSLIRICAGYGGEPGMIIKELEQIAQKHGLKQRKAV